MLSIGKFANSVCLGVLTVFLASCAHLNSDLGADHPLNGKLWDVSAQRFIDPDTLAQRAADARFVLLGEIHDNKKHHEIQAQVLEQVVRSGRRPALVMEQYDRDQQDKIDAILNGGMAYDDKAHAMGELMRKSWDWPAYEPLVRVALRNNLPVVAANMSREELRRVSRQGFSALGADEDKRLELEAVWTPERQKQLIQDIYDGHCGKVPQHVVEAIAKAQRVRDAVMADMMLKFKDSGVVAIVGSGHARRDMAVPLYLRARAPEAALLSLGLTQVDMPHEPAPYANGAFGKAFDYVWFTPRAYRRVDPCESIPEQSKQTAR